MAATAAMRVVGRENMIKRGSEIDSGHQVAMLGLIERGRHDGVCSLLEWGTYTFEVDAVGTVVAKRLFLVPTNVVVK